MRFSVVLSVLASGKKLKPMLIFKNLKKVPRGDYPNDVLITVAQKGTMTSALMDNFRKEIWQKRRNFPMCSNGYDI